MERVGNFLYNVFLDLNNTLVKFHANQVKSRIGQHIITDGNKRKVPMHILLAMSIRKNEEMKK